MSTIFNELITEWDEIVSINAIGEQDTIDINVSGNKLFYANDILTHNSSVEEVEFDHSHISGGLSKIQTADNVFGIFTSRAMRERGKYQIQLMKTRSSSGVGQKIDLDFNIDTLRITDPGEDGQTEYSGSTTSSNSGSSSIINALQRTSTVVIGDNPAEGLDVKKTKVEIEGSKLRQLLNNINTSGI